MNLPKAIHKAVLFLEQFGPEPTIYRWYENAKPPLHTGLRVAEVSFVERRSDGTIAGSSYMQSNPDGLTVCAAVERLILAYMSNGNVDLAEEIITSVLKGD